MWHQKYSLPFINVIIFVACIVTSKVLGSGASERVWGDVKKIKSDKRSDIISDVSEKQTIVYTYAYIESYRIEKYNSDTKLNDNDSSHNWIKDDDALINS